MRINVFVIGDPYDLHTWSNVPYFLMKSLEGQDVEVCRFNLLPEKWLSFRLYRLWLKRWFKLVPPYTDQWTFRNRAGHLLVCRNIRKISREAPKADINLFLTFSFSSYKYSETPVIHYCDRTFEHMSEEMGRRITWRDRFFIEVEKTNLEKAALVLTLNEPCREHIRSRYRNDKVHLLKAGINLDMASGDKPETLIALKERCRDILFIGRGASYKRGVDILVRAFQIFNKENRNEFTLHLVGVKTEELEASDEKIKVYPFLRKDDPNQLAIYTGLLASARLFVFPIRWGPLPGAIREAQWACTPVIMSNVSNAGERVRNEEDGILVDRFEPEDFALQMTRLVRDKSRWREMAMQAHRSVVNQTWDNTALRLLQFILAEGVIGSQLL